MQIQFSNHEKSKVRLAILLFLVALILVSCNYPPVLKHKLETTIAAESAMMIVGDFPIADDFLPFLKLLGEDQTLIGRPISHAYTDPSNGNTIQYFEKTRIEVMKKRLGEDEISITPLGEWSLVHATGNEVIIDQDCILLPEADFQLCQPFRSFYENHHGSILLGLPISNVYQNGDRFYQYFKNSCLVWDPYAFESDQVNLINLGQMALLTNEPYRDAITHSSVIESMTHQTAPQNELQVYVAFEETFIALSEIQQVYIQVLDTSGLPVSEASVGVLVHFPDDTHQQYRPESTDANGMTAFSMMGFEERDLLINDIVTVEVFVTTDQAEGYTTGWFRIWE